MRVVKKYLVLSVMLLFYLCVVSILLQQFYVYQRAYQNLSKLLSHPSLEVIQEKEGD